MSSLHIVQRRLANQRISQSYFDTPPAVIEWLGAIQGQDYTGAKWSIGLRLPGSTDDQIEQAIAGNRIIRTWLMRGTLHLVSASDVGWLLALIAPRQIAGSARRYLELELDENTLHRASDLFVKALEKSGTLTRSALRALLEESGISGEGQRTVHMLQYASLNGLIYQGVTQGGDPTFRLFQTSAEAKTRSRDEALAELAQRYFTSRGPATIQDYIGWSGLTAAEARAGVELVKSALVQEMLDGQTYLFAPSIDVKPQPAPTAYALPGFDEYLLGYKERSTVLDPQYAQQVCPGKNGIFFPTIVIDGRIVGTWKRTIKKQSVIITTAPFTSLTDEAMSAFTTAVQRYGGFLGLPIVLS